VLDAGAASVPAGVDSKRGCERREGRGDRLATSRVSADGPNVTGLRVSSASCRVLLALDTIALRTSSLRHGAQLRTRSVPATLECGTRGAAIELGTPEMMPRSTARAERATHGCWAERHLAVRFGIGKIGVM